MNFRWFLVVVIFIMTSCAPPQPVVEEPAVTGPVLEVEEEPVVEEAVPTLTPVEWGDVTGWGDDEQNLAMSAFLQSCTALRWREQWQASCQEAAELKDSSPQAAREFFEKNFTPHQVRQADGSAIGTMTGYYVPDLKGSRYPSSEYPYPLYGRPDDLLTIDLSDVYPDLGNYRLRGRLDGHRVIPYWDRGEIDSFDRPLAGQELFWVADPVELFFLHIQGSGRIVLDTGEKVMVNYADQNGHPYKSIGKYMIERGIMARSQMSMQNIRKWARDNPKEVDDLLGQNPSYVFFRELDQSVQSPPGALGVPLTPERSLAVDRRYVPLGAPVFVNTTWPNDSRPLNRLMMAQDTGGAIKGRIRGDFFWGMGDDAGAQAGRMKQDANFWVLLPKTDQETP